MSGRDELLNRVKQGRFLIDGTWVEPRDRRLFDVITPSTELMFASPPCANAADIADAVAAARRAFDIGPWPGLSPQDRGAFLARLADAIDARSVLFADLWTFQVGGLN